MDDNSATNLCELTPQIDESPAAGPQLPVYLIVQAGGVPGSMLRMKPGGTRVGRASDNTLRLPDGTVSRHHAVIRTGGDGKARLTDLASMNGTYLNGRRITNHTPVALHDGDRIRFGSSIVVKFSRPDPSEEQFQREMFERTVRDALTGLYNRSYFLDQVDLLADASRRRGLGLAILLLDVDHFKRINDTHGHEAGDSVLREVAAVIRQATRSEDLVARYGGEEFIVALPIAAPDQATERAERIRRNLAGRRIVAARQSLSITISIGMAFAPAGNPRPIGALFAAADLCLYQAKYAGRDRVVCSQGPASTATESVTWEEAANIRQPASASQYPAVSSRHSAANGK